MNRAQKLRGDSDAKLVGKPPPLSDVRVRITGLVKNVDRSVPSESTVPINEPTIEVLDREPVSFLPYKSVWIHQHLFTETEHSGFKKLDDFLVNTTGKCIVIAKVHSLVYMEDESEGVGYKLITEFPIRDSYLRNHGGKVEVHVSQVENFEVTVTTDSAV
uniref:Uncharacterized protein n=1 Tax=Spumella elongata TaxID=89044 RepID=A0A7S3GWJ5_9STRA|eukprot:CAMPEP_0185001960 /NCGR_PEP_ID=MMETSP1098-20130426/72515_1 /TAXON_ID=89044 /ORGANISM="Spumella elongata, Strain CCAP 955/1" /LENGTH=159 /DNA_ID=CAMNT_0027529345 /DNA_START=27 /DNA_END=506 /DNA_ORIENTATION=+